jgi:hypothetical protein
MKRMKTFVEKLLVNYMKYKKDKKDQASHRKA